MFEYEVFRQLMESYRELTQEEVTDKADYVLDDGTVVEVEA